MLKVTNLTKKYSSNLAVDNLSMTLEPGRVYGFLGPNGAGKSTTLNMITGCLGPTSGTVEINGHDISREPRAAKSYIGYLPEFPPLYEEMTVGEYLEFVYDLKGLGNSIRDKKEYEMHKRETVADAVSMCRLESVENRLIRNLSKGFKQRTGVAQAVIGKPEIIILDEPTVGLDPAQLKDIRGLIRRLGREHTVIFSSHILSEVSAVCDYVYIISKGRLVASDSVEELSRSFNRSQVLNITIEGDEGDVEKLRKMPEISGCTISSDEGGVINLRLTSGAGEDIRQKVLKFCGVNGIALLEISSTKMSLEDIFMDLTAPDETDVPEKED